MMKDMSMHILDIVQNSIAAEAQHITVSITEDAAAGLFALEVEDDGRGMDAELLARVRSPFVTSRTTRRVGLGIPLLEQTCSTCGGRLEIDSAPGQGTRIYAAMEYGHIDRPPLGDVGSGMYLTIITNPDIDFIYRHVKNGSEFLLDMAEVRQVLEGVPVTEPSVSEWIRESILEGLRGID